MKSRSALFVLCAAAAAGVASASLVVAQGDKANDSSLNGQWIWRSFLVTPATPPEEPKTKLWAYGKLNVSTDAEGRIKGELNFPSPKPDLKLALRVTGRIIPPKDRLPASLEATGTGFDATAGATYEIRGWLVPGDGKGRTIVRGSVMNVGPDLGKEPQPPRTVGTFFLEPDATQ